MKSETKKKAVKLCVYAVFALGIVFCLLTRYDTRNTGDSAESYMRMIELTGTYSEDGGTTWETFDESKDVQSDKKKVILRAHTRETIPAGERVMLYLYRMNIEVNINQKPVLKKNGNDVTKWTSFPSKGITPEDDIELTMTLRKKNTYIGSYQILLEHLQSGTMYGLLRKQVRNNIVKIIFCILICMMGLASLIAMLGMASMGIPESRGFFSCGLLLIIGGICTFIDYDYITLIFHNEYFVNLIDFLSQLLIVLLLMIYLKNYLQTKKYVFIVDIGIIAWMLNIMIYFIITSNQQVHESGLINTMLIEGLIFIAVEAIFLVLDFRTYNEKRIKYILLSSGVLGITTVAEMIHYYMTNIFWIDVFQAGLIIFCLVQYWVNLSYSRERMLDAKLKKQMEAELANNRIAIMISQIQPHFLYNTLTVIYNLCGKEPEKAKYATARFSEYLRGNLDALHEQKPVSFDLELEHIKIYLDLEKMRFGDELNVVFDIQTSAFEIPSLAIQPLVENAVKHGLGNKENGGTITLHTSEYEEYYEIKIEDDGVGFDINAKKEDGRTHIGIENVRKRLWSMSHATVHITSKINEGTIVVVRIPKENRE